MNIPPSLVHQTKQVDENTAVVIDAYEKLSGSTDWPDNTWPQER